MVFHFMPNKDTPEGTLYWNYDQSSDGRFHVKGPRKNINVKKYILYEEVLKNIRYVNGLDLFLDLV